MGTRGWLLIAVLLAVLAVPAALASGTAPTAGADATAATSTTVIVASGAPVPVPQLPPTRIGPFVGPAEGSGLRAAWWLLILGGIQVVALMVLTRRTRARVRVGRDNP